MIGASRPNCFEAGGAPAMLDLDPNSLFEPAPLDAAEERKDPQWWCCRTCGQRLTRAADQISFDGSHQHRFLNPHGFEFYIRLFSGAPGLRPEGESTDHFSWFVGYKWRIGYCGNCRTHLGWTFASIGSPGPGEPLEFTGLVAGHIELTGES